MVMSIVPGYLRGHEAWANAYMQNRGRWPTEQDLKDTLEAWWTRPSAQMPSYISPRMLAAAQAFKADYERKHPGQGRYPGMAEIPQALALTALPGAERLEETPERYAIPTIKGEISQVLQGAGGRVFEELASRLRNWDYQRMAVGGKKPEMGFADYLRSELPGMIYGGGPAPERQTAEGFHPAGVTRGDVSGPAPPREILEVNLPAGVTWADVSGPGAGSYYSDPEGMRAVSAAYMKQFNPYARGDFFDALARKITGIEDTYLGQTKAQGGTKQSYADWLSQAMQGYL